MIDVDTLIIGAGPSGLSAAYRLLANGTTDFLILEGSDAVGGLCQSLVTNDGAVFDVGGHSFHTPHTRVKQIVDTLTEPYGGLEYSQRDARILFHGTEIPYPFQQYFDKLPDEELKEECRAGLESVKDTSPDRSNLLVYLYTKFGYGITDHFMRPYNEKLWSVNLERIVPSWAGERIASSTKGTFSYGDKRKPLETDTFVGYPRVHGFVGIFQAMANAIGRHKIAFNTKVLVVSAFEDTVLVFAERFGVQTTYRARRLISTIPITTLAKMIPGFSKEHDEIENELFHTSMILHLAEVSGYAKGLETPQRLYVSSDECPAHKIAFNNLSTTQWSQSKTKAIMFECSYFDKPPSEPMIRNMQHQNLSFLANHGYIASDVPISQSIIYVKYSYPIYTQGYSNVVAILKEGLSRLNIYSIGRFGSWSYVNSDGCIHEALELVDRIS